jgi:hypothetical protein
MPEEEKIAALVAGLSFCPLSPAEDRFLWQVVELAVQPAVWSVLVIVQVWLGVQASRSELLNTVLRRSL